MKYSQLFRFKMAIFGKIIILTCLAVMLVSSVVEAIECPRGSVMHYTGKCVPIVKTNICPSDQHWHSSGKCLPCPDRGICNGSDIVKCQNGEIYFWLRDRSFCSQPDWKST